MEEESKSIELGWPSRYQIKKELEKGALGSLFLAFDQQLKSEVLVKIASPWFSEDREFKAYVYDRWAEKETLFEHPNIAGIIEVGRRTGCYFLVTEYPGEDTLAGELKNAPIDPDRAIELLHQIGEALRAAHRRNVACRHLRPEDIYITADPSGRPAVKVMFVDMNVSAGNAAGAMTGESFGLPKYMAPEVIKGNTPGPHSDIFSLGVIAYEMLTGREPFTSEHQLGYLFANCQNEPPDPRDITESVPPELSKTVLRCLAKNPAERYRSVQRVLDDLERCADIIRTGTCAVVPRGTDSALARDYDLPAPHRTAEYGKSKGSKLAYAAFIVAVIAALFTVAVNLRAPPRRERYTVAPDIEREAEVPADVYAPVPEPQDPYMVFNERFERLITRWERRYLPAEDFRSGADSFVALARDWEDSRYGDSALEKAASIYVAWGEKLEAEGDIAAAEEKYLQAEKIAPEDSEFESIYIEKLPGLLLVRAKKAFESEMYADAEEFVDELMKRFPRTEAARAGAGLRPAVMLARAAHKRDRNETASAIETLEKLVREFPDAAEAQKARGELLPRLYLEKMRAALRSGDIESVRRDISSFGERFPGSEVLEKVEELEAELLYGEYVTHLKESSAEAAAAKLELLLAGFGETRYAFQAARMQIGLSQDETAEPLDVETASGMIEGAAKDMKDGRFSDAVQALKTVIRRSGEDIGPGWEAIQMLPESLYREVVTAYGTGTQPDFAGALRQIIDGFTFTDFVREVRRTLAEYENTPRGMAYVPAGDFVMGAGRSDIIDRLAPYYPDAVISRGDELNMILQLEGYASEMPAHVAFTDAFYIDLTPVTKRRYSEFAEETGHGFPPHWVEGAVPSGREDMPVTNIAYSDAVRFAEWAGKRLPSEIEWEKAARGVDGRLYPWGEEFREGAAHHLMSSTAGPETVGLYVEGKSPYGVLDMIGNVCEWTSSFFLPYSGNEMLDHRAPYGEEFMVLRSGAWDMDDTRGVPATVTRRYPREPDEPARFIGFRCVKDPQ